MQKISVATMFDCTETGTRHHHRKHNDHDKWNYMRNQQRNWETFLQCISLRCQPLNINGPRVHTNENQQKYWTFSFEYDRDYIFATPEDPIGLLKQDCHGVPIIVGLDESFKELFLTPYIIASGDNPNTVFQIDSNK